MNKPELIIIGGGIAGSAAALRAAQNGMTTAWLLGSERTFSRSRAAWVKNIDNMVGVHPDIVRQKVVESLREEFPEAAERVRGLELSISTRDIIQNAVERLRTEFSDLIHPVQQEAASAERVPGGFRVTTSEEEIFEAPGVVLCTGVMDRQPVIYKQKGDKDLSGSHWIYPYANHQTALYCLRSESHLIRDRRVALIGDDSSSADVALLLRERLGCEVHLLTAGKHPTWDRDYTQLLELSGIPVHTERIVDIRGEDKGATLHGFTLEGGVAVDVDYAFIGMGLHRVYHELALQLGARLELNETHPEARHVFVDSYGETSVPGLFAIGDMATRGEHEPMMKQVYTAQEYAVRAVDCVDRRRRRAIRRELLGRSS